MTSRGQESQRRERHGPQAWFPLAAALWFLGWSGQGVVFSWIAIDGAGVSAGLLGALQTAIALPAPALALFGGAAADRLDRRRLAAGVHVAMGLLAAALAAAVAADALTPTLLLAYALAAGSAGGVAMTARAALLADVAGTDALRAVTVLTIAQSVAQVAGPLAAASAAWVGPAPALAVLSGCFLAGAGALSRLRSATSRHGAPDGESTRRSPLDGFAAGWTEAASSPPLRRAVLASAAHAFGMVGPLHVLLPLLARDVYHADVSWLGSMAALFPAGIVSASVFALAPRQHGSDRDTDRRTDLGRATLAGLAAAGLAVAAMALGLPSSVFAVVVYAWGAAAAVVFNSSRTVVQGFSSDERRGRVVAAHAVVTLAAGAASTSAAGAIAAAAGPLAACAAFGAATVAAAGLLAATGKRAQREAGGRRGEG